MWKCHSHFEGFFLKLEMAVNLHGSFLHTAFEYID